VLKLFEAFNFLELLNECSKMHFIYRSEISVMYILAGVLFEEQIKQKIVIQILQSCK
jgi:hypothetical protein